MHTYTNEAVRSGWGGAERQQQHADYPAYDFRGGKMAIKKTTIPTTATAWMGGGGGLLDINAWP